MRRAFWIGGVLLLIALFLFMGPQVHQLYQYKKRVASIVQLAETVSDRVAQFYNQQKRLPTAQEAAQFRVSGDGYFKSIDYDAERKMVVVTMEIRDEQFAIRAEEKVGAVTWTCRTINFPEGDLPHACR